MFKITRPRIFIPLAMLAAPLTVAAEGYSAGDSILFFDQQTVPFDSLNFQRDRDLLPEPSDFRIVASSFLSNELGERWALITFENQASGQRLLKNEAIVATFADGYQRHSMNLDQVVKGGDVVTLSVSFGVRRFPIVGVSMR